MRFDLQQPVSTATNKTFSSSHPHALVVASTPVSTVPLGLIHRVDPSLAAQLREDPASLAVHMTRIRVYSTMRLIRTGMLGQLASLQQWEEAMHAQDGQ